MKVLSFAEELSLEQFLSLVQRENLDIKSAQIQAEASKSKTQGLILPSPEIGFIQMKENSGTSAQGFEITQMIPYPGKISADLNVREAESQFENQEFLFKKREILIQAKLAFFKAWLEQEELAILKSKRSVIENHVKLARTVARSDTFSMVHLLKSESDLDMNENELIEKEQSFKTALSKFAVLTNQNQNLSHIHLVEPSLTLNLKQLSVEESPSFQSNQLNLQLALAKAQESKSTWYPDFTLKYKELGATSMAGPYQEYMIGLSLPFVFGSTAKNNNFESQAQKIKSTYMLESSQKSLKFEVESLTSKLDSLKKQIDNLKSKLIPRAEKRVHLLHNISARDMETLLEHRETSEVLLDLKLKLIRTTYEMNETMTMLEKFLPEETKK